MKSFVFYILSTLFLLSACEEVPPFIDFSEPVKSKDTSYILSNVPAAQHKAVLIEDVTGVRCNNCPQAAEKAKDIVSKKTKDSVVVMALYSGEHLPQFTTPWDGFPVLNSSIASQIVSVIGVPTGLPSGYVDRNKFGSQTVRYNSYTTWSNLVDERLKLGTPVNISLTKNLAGRMLTLKMKLEYTSAVTGNHKYALYLTESGIISKQTTVSSYDDNYVHNHVLRAAFGSAVGNALVASLIAGRVFEKEIEFEIPAEYIINNCHIVCVVSSVETEAVINVREIDLK